MNRATKSMFAGIGGLALAVPLIYLFEPKGGPKRRETLGAQYDKTKSRLEAATRRTREQLSDQYHSASARAKSWLANRTRPDATLASTVRMNLWRAVPPLTGIGVVAHNGEVILHGDVLAQEHDRVLQLVRSVPGVAKVADHLSPVSALSPPTIGPRVRQGLAVVRDSLAEPHWSTPTRVSTGTMGLALVRLALQHRNVYGGIAALAGAALITRSIVNQPLRTMRKRSEPVESAIQETVQAAKAGASRAGETLHASKGQRNEMAAGAA